MTNIAQEILQTYLVAGTQDTGRENFLPILDQALQAGITCFQFRDRAQIAYQLTQCGPTTPKRRKHFVVLITCLLLSMIA